MLYLGHLPSSDPLYDYLRREILPQLGATIDHPDFRVFRVSAFGRVYVYQERRSRTQMVGKFFGTPGQTTPASCRRMHREFEGLSFLRRIGFAGYPHYVARPLGRNKDLCCLVAVEHCSGTSLDEFISRAIWHGGRDALFRKLTALGYFLATLHNRTGQGVSVDFDQEVSYFNQLTTQLLDHGRIGWAWARELCRRGDQWRERSCMWQDQQVMVHGDVTPTNVLFGDGLWVIAIDLERMKAADRVFDLGRVAAELKHAFWLHTGEGRQAEPFIGHFLWEYACHFPNRHSAFAAVTQRLPFYMAANEIRIARNDWVGDHHRRRLLQEAGDTLR